MVDRWSTYTVSFEGGLIENLPPLEQGANFPGSLREAQNFEPSSIGGYRKIMGHAKYDTEVVPGTGEILGIFPFLGFVLACRNDKIYRSSGSGWTLIHTQPYTPTSHYMCDRYNWSSEKIILVDGTNRPITYDGTTVTTLSSAPTATSVKSFSNHMCFTDGNQLVISSPNDETDYTVANGAAVINTGTEKTGLAIWRNALYVFGTNSIDKLVGTSSADFSLTTVTDRLGIVSNKTIRELSGDIYYVAYDGVRTISGTDRIGDIQLESITRNIPDTMESLPFRNSAWDVSSAVVREKSQYRVFVGKSDIDEIEGLGLLGGIRLSSQGSITMEWYRLKGINCVYSDSNIHNNVETVVHAGYDGYVYQQEQGNSFNSVDINAYIRFPYWPLGDNEIRKTLYKGRIYLFAQANVSPVLQYTFNYLDSGTIQPPAIQLGTGDTVFDFYGDMSSTYGAAVYGENFAVTSKNNLVGSGNNVSFLINANDSLGSFSVQNITVEFSTNDRR